MGALGLAMILLGALLVYAGLTGDSLVKAIAGVLRSEKK